MNRVQVAADNRKVQVTHRCRIILGRLVVKKLPTFSWTQMFITAFTTVRHLSFSGAKWILFTSNSVCFKIHFNIVHLFLSLQSGIFPSGFPPTPLRICFPIVCATFPAHVILNLITQIVFVEANKSGIFLYSFLSKPLVTSSFLSQTSCSAPCSR